MENENQFQERITNTMISDQRALNAVFRAVEMVGEEGKKHADLLASIILSNQMDILTNHEEISFVESLTASIQNELTESLRMPVPHDKDAHEELIHAYVSLSKALEYQRLMSEKK